MSEIDTESVLRRAATQVDEAEVFLVSYNDLALEQRGTEISSVFEHAGTTVYLRVVKNGRIGISATSDITRIDDAIASAVSSANLSGIVENWAGFPEKATIPSGNDPIDHDLEISTDIAAEYLSRMNAGAATHPESRPVSGGVTLTKGSSHLMNTNGVDLCREYSEITVGMDAICDGSTGYSSDSSPFSSRISPETVGKETAFYASASRNGTSIKSGKYDVVFSEDVVTSLVLGLLMDAVDGKNVLTGKSIYAGKLQQMVANPLLSIRDVPQHPDGSAWRRFDTEGTPAHDLDIIHNGLLSSYLYDAKTAAQAGARSTGHGHRSSTGSTFIGPHCLTISAPVEDIMEKPCLYVKEVIGAHTANPLTGEFSVETANTFLAENGEFVQPVRKAMLAGNIFDILAGSLSISPNVKTYSCALVPKMRISDLQVISEN